MSESRASIDRVVAEVSKIVEEMAGVQLGERQKSMVENRLRTRMMRLNVAEFQGYLTHLNRHREEESQALLSLMTTHHTFFFREFAHFEYLLNKVLPGMIEACRRRGDRKIRIWSAACSRGQEAYSLAMFFSFHLREAAPDIDFEIEATDVDPESVEIAKNGVYRIVELNQAPAMYARNQWIHGKGSVAEFGKIRPELKAKVKFGVMNLLEPKTALDGKNFDIVFCRNVFIYFNKDQIKKCTTKILEHLDVHGHLFLGVSESIAGLGLPVQSLGSSIHRRAVEEVKAVKEESVPALAPTKPLRVFSVDDSPTILALLNKILTPDQGFELVGTAANGRLAIDWLKKNTCDLITLDIHMPVLDGVGFLEETRSANRPPVLVLSSVNREEPTLGQKVLSLGAFDYVEKPSLQNVAQAGNEIRAKLRLAALAPKGALAVPAAKSASPSPGKTASTEPVKTAPAAAPRPSVQASKKKVLVVDDSQTIRQLLRQIVSADPGLELVAEAELPSQVEALIQKHRPDVITLDIHMPEMNGVELLKRIHPKYKIPTVMISSISREESDLVLQALESGAVDYIQKPSMKDMGVLAEDIRERVKMAANTKSTMKLAVRKATGRGDVKGDAVVLLGSSTGGTEALRHILTSLPNEIPPIVCVQHIPPVFSAAFASRLDGLCPFEVKEAADGDEVKGNRVLIAPGGKQMGFQRRGDKLHVRITDEAPMNRHKPSVDYMFKSAVDLGLPSVVAGVLTGMGADGARGLKTLRDKGARTFAQDAASSVVYGMPREAAELGGAESIESLERIADLILRLVSEKNGIKKAG